LLAALCTLLPSCATTNPPQPPSLQLPQPPKDLRASRKGNSVILRWSVPVLTTDRQRTRSLGATKICRSLDPAMIQCGNAVGEAPALAPPKPAEPKLIATYTDALPHGWQQQHPMENATYAVEVLNAVGKGAGVSNRVQVPMAETPPPPADFSARLEGGGVALAWSAAAPFPKSDPRLGYAYRVYRRAENGKQPVLIGEIPATESPNYSLIDANVEWEQAYYYRANVTVLINTEGKQISIEGDDTPELKVFTHDVFPPAVPSGLQAVFSGPGQQPYIDLIWAPVTDADLAGYNVYRRQDAGDPVKLNTEPVRAPAYLDTNIASGTEYTYSVSSIDVRGNESSRSEEASERVP
jgi:hypothetical protein